MKLERSTAINVLIAALAAATTVLVFATYDAPTTAEIEARARNLLPEFTRAGVRSLSVRGADGSFQLAVLGTRDEPRYELRAPQPLPVDPEAVESWLRALELAGFVRRLDADEDDRSALGLDQPKGEIQIELAQGQFHIGFGKDALTPAGTSYVEVRAPSGARAAYLVRSELVRELLIGKDALRPRALLPLGFSEVAALRFRDATASVELRRTDGPDFVGAGNERVRRDTVERLGLELSRVKSDRFVDASAAKAAIDADPQALSVEITPKGGKPPIAFRLGGRCPGADELEVLWRTAPHASAECVGRGARQLFRETRENLRDDAPFSLRSDEVESLRLERDGAVLELERKDGAFRLVAPTTADVELDAGNARLEAIVGARGERVERPDLARLGLALPAGKLRLRSTVVEGTPRFDELLEIGRVQRDGRLPVRRSRDGVVLLLPADAASAYDVDSTLLKSRRLLDFGPSELQSLTISSHVGRQRLVREGDAFRLVEPKGHQHEGGLVLDLVQTLGTLTADRWVAEAPQPVHELDQPRAVLTLELGGAGKPPRTVTLTLGAETPSGVFAKLDTQTGVFLLPRSFATQATELLISRDVFQTDPARLSTIVLERGRTTFTLRRSGERFVSAEGLPSPAVERIVHAISGLRPEAALRVGPARPEEGFGADALVVRLTPTDAAARPKVIRVGRGDTLRSLPVFYARVDGVDATYALPERAVRALSEPFPE